MKISGKERKRYLILLKDVLLNYERESHWYMVFKESTEGWMVQRNFYMRRSGMYKIR